MSVGTSGHRGIGIPDRRLRRSGHRSIFGGAAAVLITLAVAPIVWAQAPPASQGPTPRIELPPVTVVAEKEPLPIQRVPVSVTAVSADRLDAAGVAVTSDAAWFAPNTFYSDLSARKISNARFRGIGSSPANPGITTFVDGVPQLNTNTANVDLLEIDQIEFVRGASSAFFGRNTLGGVVNVTSRWPSLTRWIGRVSVPLGTDAERGFGALVSGPIVADRVAATFALSATGRDGYTVNTVTGATVDDRSAVSAKGQVAFTSSGPWSARLLISAERDRDGDYALSDLATIRSDPFRVARDFEGHADRDILGTTMIVRREGARMTLTSTTGVVDWQTFDETDLDYTPAPLVTRQNRENATQFTQEVRLASAATAPVRLADRAMLRWQAGVFGFTQRYDQEATNTFSPYVLSPEMPFAVASRSQPSLDDGGIGVFGHATTTFGDRVDLAAGVRVDYESRDATLGSAYEPPIVPESRVQESRAFTDVSPQFAVTYRPSDVMSLYGTVARGFKAGGFNAASPPGAEAYGQEHAWHVEGGIKTSVAGGRVALSAAAFTIDWSDLQLNLPNPAVPGQFYIANVGAATSRGVEFDVRGMVSPSLVVIGAVGSTRARFSTGSMSSGVDISDNRVPLTPDFTVMGGAELSRPLGGRLSLVARADVVGYGSFEYDEFNGAHQDAYALTNFRAGVRVSKMLIEAWVRNAFDTKYVPVAFAYDPQLAPSGYLGEPGRPRTAGIRVGVDF